MDERKLQGSGKKFGVRKVLARRGTKYADSLELNL
jgi:hypothetical protein